ncbi:MAG TPA: aminotransferase class V-fold PLP-dependent enzyme [Candidatus Limnocylindrales bacterium]|nr:aminotransferase class V-fold PLP-dependent enzyme [Candidatus Limnocylindrales bacterium]
MVTGPPSDAERVAALRELLPATGAGIYLDTATRGPLPAEAAEAMREAFEWDIRVGRVAPGREEDLAQRGAETRAVVAAVLGATDPDAIVLTHGLGDALELARRAVGEEAAVHHVDPVSGALVGTGGVRVLDASLSIGALPLNVEQLDADAAVVAGDRWLLGPEGIGALWLRDGGRARALPERELSRQLLLGLARSVGWLAMFVGLEWAHSRTAALAARLAAGLENAEGVEMVTPSPPPAAIVSFRLSNWPAEDAADELNHRTQALTRPLAGPDIVRASVAWFNTEAEIDRFAEAVAELGRHTAETLPRRPRLVVLQGG